MRTWEIKALKTRTIKTYETFIIHAEDAEKAWDLASNADLEPDRSKEVDDDINYKYWSITEC